MQKKNYFIKNLSSPSFFNKCFSNFQGKSIIKLNKIMKCRIFFNLKSNKN